MEGIRCAVELVKSNLDDGETVSPTPLEKPQVSNIMFFLFKN